MHYVLALFLMVWSMQASVSTKRLGDFLQNKDLDNNNVFQCPHSEETGNSIVFLNLTTLLP